MTDPTIAVPATEVPPRSGSAVIRAEVSPGGAQTLCLDALDLLVEEVVRFAGFDVAAIGLVRDDELEWVSVCCDSHTDSDTDSDSGSGTGPGTGVRTVGAPSCLPVAGSRVPLAPVLERLVDDGAESWLRRDHAMVALQDDAQVLRGVLSLDRPREQHRPGPRRHQIIEQHVAQARRAVLVALEREELGRRMTMARAARRAVRYATTRLSLDGIAEECRGSLATAFRAGEVWLRLADSAADSTAAPTPPATVGLDAPFQAMMLRLEREAWTRQQPLILTPGRPAPEILAPEDVERLRAVMTARGIGSALLAPLGSGSECLGRLVLCRRDGEEPWTEVEAESALDVGHDLGRAVLNARTWEREHELVERLQALDSYKTRLIATVAHELKTPLTSVLGNLELLDDGLDPAHRLVALAAANRGARRLSDLVDDLLLLSRVAEPDAPSAQDAVDLVAVAREVRDLTSTGAAQQQQVVVVEDPGHPVLAIGDRRQLDRVVTNLVSNALKYSAPGSRVTLGFDRRPGEVVLRCADEGIGISAPDQEHLFREFFRSEDPSTQRQSGTGLGLSIVERILARHGGGIEVHSEPGRGSTFVVHLPGASGKPAGPVVSAA